MVLGIAGGVGSGKSTVLKILAREYDAVICMADELGHEAMEPGTQAYEQMIQCFGEKIRHSDGLIDRDKLSSIVYQDTERLEQLNGIIHPFVKAEIRKRIKECRQDRIFVLETAILFETGCHELCDEVWGIQTEDEIRIQRLMQSRGYAREKAVRIMENQMSNKELAEKCDRVLTNDGEPEELVRQISRHMENLLEKQA